MRVGGRAATIHKLVNGLGNLWPWFPRPFLGWDIVELNWHFRDFPGGSVVKTSPSNAGGAGSIPGRGVESPHASWKQYCNKFNKDFKNGSHQKHL